MQITKRKPETVDEYLDRANPDQRAALNKFRKIIRTVVPKARGVHQLRNSCVSPQWTFTGFLWRVEESLRVLSGKCRHIEKLSERAKEFSNQQRDDSLLSGQTAAGRVGEEARQNANRREQRSSKQKEDKIMSTVRVLVGTKKGRVHPDFGWRAQTMES